MATPALPFIFEPQWFVPLFAVAWFGSAAVMARIAGWSGLARLFPAPPRVTGETLRFVSVSLGSPQFPIRYRNCVRLVVGEAGLQVSLMFPFRFASPAFFAPWSDVEAADEQQLLSTRTVTLRFRGNGSHLTLRGPIGQLVLDAWRQGTRR